MSKITSEKDFLTHFIRNANEFGEVDIDQAFPDDIISPLDLHEYLKSLTQKGFIQFNDFQHYNLTPAGRQEYIPTSEKIAKPVIKGLKITMKQIVLFLISIASAIIVAVALHWLGLD